MKQLHRIMFVFMLILLLTPVGAVMANDFLPNVTIPTAKPVLLAPRDGAIRLELKPDLQWKSVVGSTRYQVQMTSAVKWDPIPEELMDVSFVPADLTATVVRFKAENYPADGLDWLTPNRFYRWHVRACVGDAETDCGPWSATRKFLPRYSQTDKPGLVSPADGILVDTRTPTFEWNRLPNDKMYELKIIGPGNIRRIFVKPVEEGTVASHTLSTPLRGNTQFTWKVRAVGKNGWYYGPWSDTYTFTTPVNPTPPPYDPHQVHLNMPRNNALLAEIKPALSWWRVKGAIRYQVQLASSRDWDPIPTELMSVDFTPANLTKTLVNFSKENYSGSLDWLTPNRPYYWHVRACPDNIDDNCYPWSITRRYIPRYTQENRPALIHPGDAVGGVKIGTNNPTFNWDRLPNDTHYEIVIGNSNHVWRFWQPVSGSDPATFTLPFLLGADKTFFWRVRPVGYHGWYIGPWSDTFYFTTPPAP
jgi:hypothetical protein